MQANCNWTACNCWDCQPILISTIYYVLHLWYQVFIYVLSVIMMEYTISYREVCYLVNRFGTQFAVLHIPNPWQLPNTSLNIHSSCLRFHQLNHNHNTKECFCVIQFLFLYVHLSIHYSIQSIIVMQRNRQPAII